MQRNELYHYGVKGMKWGIIRKRAKAVQKARRDSIAKDKERSKSGERVTIREANNNARKAMRDVNKKSIPSQLKISESDSATTKKVKNDYNKMTDQEFMNKYSTSKKTYAKRVEKQGDPYTHAKARNEKIQRNVEKGAKVARTLVTTYMADKILFGGAGTKAVKSTVKQTGRAVVSAWVLANGGSNIRWYDNGILD